MFGDYFGIYFAVFPLSKAISNFQVQRPGENSRYPPRADYFQRPVYFADYAQGGRMKRIAPLLMER